MRSGAGNKSCWEDVTLRRARLQRQPEGEVAKKENATEMIQREESTVTKDTVKSQTANTADIAEEELEEIKVDYRFEVRVWLDPSCCLGRVEMVKYRNK